MNPAKKRQTLDRPVTYQIKVTGYLDESWLKGTVGMIISVKTKGDNPPVTIITGTLDQAVLQGLLRRLYSLGMPLISVIYLNEVRFTAQVVTGSNIMEDSSGNNQQIPMPRPVSEQTI